MGLAVDQLMTWGLAAFTLGAAALVAAAFFTKTTVAQLLFSAYVRFGRLRNQVLGPCNRAAKRYPVPITCQVPFFKSIADIYSFVFGYREDLTFVEVGAYDGESFSNTSMLGDIGCTGHYLEPIPKYAAMCRQRHVGNRNVTVHDVCIGRDNGVEVTLSTAGPFSSAVEDEIKSVKDSKMSACGALGKLRDILVYLVRMKCNCRACSGSAFVFCAHFLLLLPADSALKALGWSHEGAIQTVKTKTTSLNTFFERTVGLSKPGAVDVMVVDVEVSAVCASCATTAGPP